MSAFACSSLSSRLPTPSSPTAPLRPTKFRGAQPSGPAGQQVGSGASGRVWAGPRLPPAALHRGPAREGRSFLPPPCWPRHRVTSPRRVAARTRMCACAAGLPLPSPPPLRRERAGAARKAPLRPAPPPRGAPRREGRGRRARAEQGARGPEAAVPGERARGGPRREPGSPSARSGEVPSGYSGCRRKYLLVYHRSHLKCFCQKRDVALTRQQHEARSDKYVP